MAEGAGRAYFVTLAGRAMVPRSNLASFYSSMFSGDMCCSLWLSP